MRLVTVDPAPFVAAAGVLTPRCEGGGIPVDLATFTGESPLRFRRMDRYESLGFAAVKLALRQAPAAPRGQGDPEWGIVLGSSLGCWGSNAEFFFDLKRRATAELSPALFARTVSNAVNGETTIAHRIGGLNQTFVSGWTSGGEALAEAAVSLAEGRARFVLAGGIEAPDESLRRMHTARRLEPFMDWLPHTIDEGAAVCLLTSVASPGCLRVRAFGQVHDPAGTWSLAEALGTVADLSVRTVFLANTVPPWLLERWRDESQGADIVSIPERAGEMGAAGAPAAVALAGHPSREEHGVLAGALVVARAPEGGTVALVLGA